MAKNKLSKELEVNAPLSDNMSNNNAPASNKQVKDNKEKKPNIFKRMGNGLKSMFSELKKVTWPTWKVAATSLLTVLVVVLVFVVIIMVFDFGASELLKLLTNPQ